MLEAYFLSHNGLGDNLYSIGAVRCLTQFYKTVYFLCKENYYDNCVSFFENEPNVKCIPISCISEFEPAYKIINPNYNNTNADIFICGSHKSYLRSKITNHNYLEYIKNIKTQQLKYNLTHDTITDANYSFIDGFYKDIGLNVNIFYDFWKLPETAESLELYKSLTEYSNIVFIQNKCSDGRQLNINSLIKNKQNSEDTILICNDENLYSSYHKQYTIAQKFVKLSHLTDYITTIINANEIYIIDSCFVGIVLPLLKKNVLKATTVRIVLRQIAKDIEL